MCLWWSWCQSSPHLEKHDRRGNRNVLSKEFPSLNVFLTGKGWGRDQILRNQTATYACLCLCSKAEYLACSDHSAFEQDPSIVKRSFLKRQKSLYLSVCLNQTTVEWDGSNSPHLFILSFAAPLWPRRNESHLLLVATAFFPSQIFCSVWFCFVF